MIGVALVGYGFAGRTFHAPVIASVEGMKLVAIVSRRATSAYGAHIVPTLDEALRDSGTQLVVIATPNATHAELARRALDAGKHVVIDKPFATTHAEAQALATHARQCNRVLSVFHNRRWDSDFLTLQRLIVSHALGNVVEMSSYFDRFRPSVGEAWREQSGPGAGVWFDLGAHLVDQALTLFGLPERICADIAAQRPGARVDDFFAVTLGYAQRRVLLHASSLAAANDVRYVVHGDAASFVKHGLDPQERALIAGETPGDAGWGVDQRPGTLVRNGEAPVVVQPTPGDYRIFYAGVRDAIANGSAPPVTAEQALDVMRVLELARESARERRDIVV